MNPDDMAEAEAPKVEQARIAPETPQRESLDEKFPLQTMEFGKIGKVAFRDIKPEITRPGGETPMVMMTGWAMNQEVIGNTTEALVEAGQRVVPFDIDGGGKGVDGVGDSSAEINRQGELLKKWMESRPDGKFHLVGQSMSALVVLAMIENNPDIADKIASVVLVSPMGLGGKDNLPGLLSRQGAETERNNAREKTDEDRKIEPRIAKAFKDFMLHHPIRAAKEGFAMAGSDEYNILNLLKAKGVRVGIIQGAQDQLNSSQRVVENIARQTVANSNVRKELIGEDGMEKIPDNLKILPTDSEEEVKRKQKAIIEIKLELQRTENKVPIDSFTYVEGGHEIFGPSAIADTLIRTVDKLDKQLTPEEAAQSAEEIREGVKRFRQQQEDAEQISETREELKEVAQAETSENPIQ
jgi:pimeloyl-ACP methyl ester carboxylesterase